MDGIPELASERVTTLMTPTEKANLEAKAKTAGVSIGEFVRRSVEAYDPAEAEMVKQLAEFATALDRSNREAALALDRALESIAQTRAQLRERSAA